MAANHRNPIPTVDVIIRLEDRGIILVKRKFEPHGWALPGGFVDYGESLRESAKREALEETALEVTLDRQFHTYSDPQRDPRMHTITTVYLADATGEPRAGDDAQGVGVFSSDNLPDTLCFDHDDILDDYFNARY